MTAPRRLASAAITLSSSQEFKQSFRRGLLSNADLSPLAPRPSEIKSHWGGGRRGEGEERGNRRGPIQRAGLWGVVWMATGGGGGGRRDGRSSPHSSRFPRQVGRRGRGYEDGAGLVCVGSRPETWTIPPQSWRRPNLQRPDVSKTFSLGQPPFPKASQRLWVTP